MSFLDKVKNTLTEDDYYDEEEYSLEEIKNEILFILDKLKVAKGIKGLVIWGLYKKDLENYINEFNNACEIYDISYDEEYNLVKNFSRKRYTGYYNGNKYYNGIQDLGYHDDDTPNIRIRQ